MPVYKYDFISPWLGLSQKNYKIYIEKYTKKGQKEQSQFFRKVLIGNILSFAKGVNWWIKEKIIVVPSLLDLSVRFKGEEMVGFKGYFFSNVYLPNYIGLGKSTSRGFGIIKRKKVI